MIVKVSHNTTYIYSEPVFLESNEIRLCPRSSLNLKITDYKCLITPEPSNTFLCSDSEGNSVIKTRFLEKTDNLRIEVEFTAETLKYNPYGFIADFEYTKLPFKYTPELTKDLKPHLNIYKKNDSVRKFSDDIKKEAKSETVPFLSLLCQKIHDIFEYELRPKGEPHSPEYTLKNKKGSCRDYAIFFIDVCKYRGIASRFVSGYLIDKDSDKEAHLHAWSEVYIPGAGWAGFDPTNGIAVNEYYIPVAASHNPERTLPVTGSFRSDTAESKMDVSVKISNLCD